MSIRLNWGSANSALAESIKIYRSDTTFAGTALPAVLATIAGSAVSYDDTTVVRNKTYYYRVGMVRAGEELISGLLIMGHYPDSGPGPQKILRGTWELGYFGLVPVTEFFTPNSLIAAVGSPGGTVSTEAQLTGWHKFIRRGKILFIPNYRVTGAVTWIDIYNLGLAFGVDGPGDIPGLSGFTGYVGAVNQYKPVTYGANQYLVRLPKFSDQPTNEYVTDLAKVAGSEWIELMGRMGNTGLASSPADKWNDLIFAGVAAGAASMNFSSLNYNMIVFSVAFDNTITQNMNVSAASRQTHWIPVLELIL